MRAFNSSAHDVLANHPLNIRHLGWNPDTQGVLTFINEITDTDRYIFLHNGERDLTMEEIQAGAPLPGLALLFEWTAPGVYQMHSVARPDFRGAQVIRAAKVLCYELFVEHDADMIWGATPLDNRAARFFNRKIGALPCGFREIQLGINDAGEPRFTEHELFRNTRARWLKDHWRP